LGVVGLGVGGLGVRGLGVGGLGVGGLGVGVEWISSRNRGLSRAMALHVTKSVGRSLRFSAFLSEIHVRARILRQSKWVMVIEVRQKSPCPMHNKDDGRFG
jgi:hypothetical protein